MFGVYEIKFIGGDKKIIGELELKCYLLADGWNKKQVYILINDIINNYKPVEFRDFSIRRLKQNVS